MGAWFELQLLPSAPPPCAHRVLGDFLESLKGKAHVRPDLPYYLACLFITYQAAKCLFSFDGKLPVIAHYYILLIIIVIYLFSGILFTDLE